MNHFTPCHFTRTQLASVFSGYDTSLHLVDKLSGALVPPCSRCLRW